MNNEIIKKILGIVVFFILFLLFAIFVQPQVKKTFNKLIDSAFNNDESKKTSTNKRIEEVGTDLKWYVEDPITHNCEINDGPGAMIKTMDGAGYPHKEVDEKKIGDTVVQVTLQMLAQRVQATYYRGRERCESALNKAKDNKKAVADKYN
jgi:hypothetical protein